MGLSQLNFAGLNKVEVSIMRLREFEPPEGYYLAFSGGKDSEVVYDLAVKSGVRFDAHFSVTTVDPPEVLKFIRENYPNVEWHYPFKSMMTMVVEKGFPTRQSRWCCADYKENGGEGRFVLTGIRAAESARRSRRPMVEVCPRDARLKKFLHPIIDWSTRDVWDYLTANQLKHCSLYDEGFKRIGCVLCPMQTAKQSQLEVVRFPRLARAWRIAFQKLWDTRDAHHWKHQEWKSADDMFEWWLSRKGQKQDNGQCSMFI